MTFRDQATREVEWCVTHDTWGEMCPSLHREGCVLERFILVEKDAPSILILNDDVDSCAAALGLHDHPLPAGVYRLDRSAT